MKFRNVSWEVGKRMSDERVTVEFIESYIKIGNGDYQWNDNHGELIRCKDCKYGYMTKNGAGEDAVECSNHYISLDSICRQQDWFCAEGECK